MRHIIAVFILILCIPPIFSHDREDSITRIILYPPLSSDSVIIISPSRDTFSSLGWRNPVDDSDSIAVALKMLSELEYIRDLDYSNTELPATLEVDSLGNLSWNILNPPIIGQIFISRQNRDDFDVIWLTTEGVEMGGKLYAYSEELIRYLDRKRKEREVERQHGGPRIKW